MARLAKKLKVGQLATVSGSEVPLTKSEDGFVRTVDGSVPEPDNREFFINGFLEGSNVKTVDELVSGIEQSRAYEVNVKFVNYSKRN